MVQYWQMDQLLNDVEDVLMQSASQVLEQVRPEAKMRISVVC